jgi:hypothetical protein
MMRLLAVLFGLVLVGSGQAQAPVAATNRGTPPAATAPQQPEARPRGASTGAAGQTPPPIQHQVPAAASPDDELPHDVRGRSLLRARLQVIDDAYPWLVPTAPAQWISIGLLLSVSLCLVIHVSTGVSGADGVALGRSMALAAWYLITCFVQVALVPPGQLSTGVMLLANPALALFWLCTLFGLTRGGAILAFAMQLGFVVLAYGTLELVTSILGTVGTEMG